MANRSIELQVRLRDTIMQQLEHKLATERRLTYNVNRILCTGPHQVEAIHALHMSRMTHVAKFLQILAGTTIYSKQISRGRAPACVFAFFVRSQAAEG